MSLDTSGIADAERAGVRTAPFSDADIQAVVKASYGIDAAIAPLPGEVDHNFLVAFDGTRFVLRLSPPGASQATARFQVALARHLQNRPVAGIVQKVVPNAAGEDFWHCVVAGTEGYLARSTTFLPGVLQRATPPSPAQRAAVGAALASIQLALADFDHPESRHELMWDMLQGDSVRRLAHELTEPRFADPIEALDDYLQRTLPRLRRMPAQVCHNDLNSNNVLVDAKRSEAVTGVLDFGDAIHTAMIADVAVGAAYNLGNGDDLLRGAAEFVSGFRMVRDLAPEELAVLPRLILARLAVRIIITEWRARHRPHNREYILKNTPIAWSQFDRLWQMGTDLEDQFNRASR
jgi:Ser/Thr protein kinase RdoA (MazF antagonist)